MYLFFLPNKNELSFHSALNKRIEKSDENKIENISKLTVMMSRKRTRFNQTVSMGILSQNGDGHIVNTKIQKADIQEGESLGTEAFNFIPQNICFFINSYVIFKFIFYNQLLIIETNRKNLADLK